MAHRGHPETGCPIPSLSSELGHLSEDGRGRLSRGMRGLVDGLTRLLERAGIGDPAEAANAAFSEALGALVMARLTTDPKARSEERRVGKEGAVRLELGGSRLIKKKK